MEVKTMPDTDRLLGVADPEQVSTMRAALEDAWAQVADRFTQGEIAEARAALAKAILAGHQSGARDRLALKHRGLGVLKLRYPLHFETAAVARKPKTGTAA
jgi:hypothetical protein